jgi:hypothetical protein
MAMCINVVKTKIMSMGRGAPQLLVNTPSVAVLWSWWSLSSIWEALSIPKPTCKKRLMFTVHMGWVLLRSSPMCGGIATS